MSNRVTCAMYDSVYVLAVYQDTFLYAIVKVVVYTGIINIQSSGQC